MSKILADYLHVWGFEGDFAIFTDGSLGFGLSVIPLDISCWHEDRINALSERTVQFLNGLPAGIDIQFAQEIRAGSGETISSHADLGRTTTTEIATALCNARVERLREAESRGLVPTHRLKVYVRRLLSGPLISPRHLFSSSKALEPIAEERLKAEVILIEQLRTSITQGLRSLDLEVSCLSADDLVTAMYEQWNPSRQIARGPYNPEEVRHSILFTDVSVYEKGFSLSDLHFRVLSLKLLPDETVASMAATLRELPFNSRLFVSIHVPDQQKEITSLQTQRRLAFSMARGKQTGVSDIESEAKFQDLEGLLAQMIAQGEKVFRVSLNIVLCSKNESELENQVSLALMKIRELSGAEGMEESLAAFDIFAELAAPNARATERAKRMKTSNLADLLPLYGPWRGHARPSILLRCRMGSLVPFDPFSSDLSNYNQIVSGGSGSGKSFLANMLLLQMLKEDPRVFIVDIGGSYKRLCENLSGQNVLLGADMNFSINPFDLAFGEVLPSGQKIKFLLGLVELMTKEEGERRLPRLERAEIEEAIQRVYEAGGIPSLSKLREILLSHPSAEVKRYGRILTPWCGATPFGRFVDRPTTVSLEKRLVAFDLKGLDTYPDLQAVVLFIITDFVWREAQKNRSEKKFLIFDECWKLLENEAGAAFIGEVFRTFRKYYASAIAISQNIDDFARSKVASAILSNSAVRWILMQKGADQTRLKEVLQLNDSEMGLIASLSQERGVFSEVFLMAESARAVVAVEPTPLEYWLATTDPRDLALLEERLKNQTRLSQVAVLIALSQEFPRGVAASKQVL